MTETSSQTAVFLGMSHRVLVGSEQGDGSLSVVEITVAPGAGVPPHANTREALTWCVVGGTLAFSRGGAPVEVGAGDALFVGKGEMHGFANTSSQPAVVLMIGTPGGFEGFVHELAAVFPDEVPEGPPPPEALAAMAEIAARYGVELADA